MNHLSKTLKPLSRKLIITTLSILSVVGYGVFVFAVAPPGGYSPGQTLNPDCSPGDTDCVVAVSGGGGTPAGINGYIQYNSSGSFGADNLFTRNPSTKETNIFRDTIVNVQTGEYVVNAYQILQVEVSGPGSFTIGETITGQNSGATATIEGYFLPDSEGLLYVSNISGVFTDEEIISTFPGTVVLDDDILFSSFAVGDTFMEFDFSSGPTGVTGSVTAVSGDSITVNVTGGSLTPNNILFNTTQTNNYRGIVSTQPVTVSGIAHAGFTLNNINIGTPFSGSGMYSELNGNKLFAGIVNGYQFGIFSEISGTPNGYYLPTTAGTTGQALISLGGDMVGWGTLSSAISVNDDGTIYSGTLGAGEGNGSNIFLGRYAGEDATSVQDSNFLGTQAGENATNAYQSNFLGYKAGEGATNAWNSNFFGQFAGSGATDAQSSNFLGQYAGQNATNAYSSNFLGYYAGKDATNAWNSNFLGYFAGYGATNAQSSNFLGYSAGSGATYASNSNFLGQQAGSGATNASSSNFLGSSAGNSATDASNSNFLGQQAGSGAANASSSNFFGYFAGYNATNASNSIFIGKSAGQNDTVNNTGSSDDFSILIGPNTSTGNNGSGVGYSNSIALGGYATNTASNQFMIGSSTRPINEIVMVGSSGTSCSIDVNGTVCSSDERLKTNIENLSSTLDTLMDVQTVTYNWINNPTGSPTIGFLAQNLQESYPELVRTGHDGYLQVNYGGMTPILVKAIQEMNLRITDLNNMNEVNPWREAMIAWLGNVGNGIVKIFAKKVITEEVCVQNNQGGEICLNYDKLKEVFNTDQIITNRTDGDSDVDITGKTDEQEEIIIDSNEEVSEEINEPENADEHSEVTTPENNTDNTGIIETIE